MSTESFTGSLVCMVAAFGGAVAMVVLLRPVAVRFGLVDEPDSRKFHASPTPLVGGIAFSLAFAAVASVAGFNAPVPAIFLSGAVLLLVGIFDDRLALSPWHRFAAQVAAAFLMIHYADLVLRDVGDLVGTGVIGTGAFALPFTVFCVVGLINAFNMVDGIDGLAGSLAVVASGAFGIAAWLAGLADRALALFTFAAAVCGFLLFNLPTRFRPFTVFMGDAGSMVIGLMMVWTAVAMSQSSQTDFPPIAAVWVLALPVLDTVATMIRRVVRGQSPFRPARDHLHHLLLAFGLTVPQVVLAMCLAMASLAAIGIGAWWLHLPEAALTAAFVPLCLGYLAAVVVAWRYVQSTRIGAVRTRDGVVANGIATDPDQLTRPGERGGSQRDYDRKRIG